MVNLETKYINLRLKNPIIVSSSGLTSSVNKIEQLANAGAGAVVLKSLFEEQIRLEAGNMLKNTDYPEALDYINNYARDNAIDDYLNLIEEAKNKVDIPVIASINCVSTKEWISFAKSVQEAGADALELNVLSYLMKYLKMEYPTNNYITIF
jgi:dihydroorotate dehydrogenase (fumarate)